MAASTASACLRKLSPLMYSHSNSQASLRSGIGSEWLLVWTRAAKLARAKAGKQDRRLWRSAAARGAVTRAGAHGNLLALGGDLDLTVLTVARFVGGIIANRVLRSEFRGNLRERIRQRCKRVGSQQSPARLKRQFVEVTICRQVHLIEQHVYRIALFPSATSRRPVAAAPG